MAAWDSSAGWSPLPARRSLAVNFLKVRPATRVPAGPGAPRRSGWWSVGRGRKAVCTELGKENHDVNEQAREAVESSPELSLTRRSPWRPFRVRSAFGSPIVGDVRLWRRCWKR